MDKLISEAILHIKKNLNPEVTLVAVSKTRDIDEIMEAYSCGIRDFGENKVQEMMTKIPLLPRDIRWHLIGHLQRNKVKYIVGQVNLIHSLDSTALAMEIERQYAKASLIAEALIQINIGREESKTGVLTEDLPDLLQYCSKCQHLKIRGLMAIIPKGSEEESKKYFSYMKSIFDSLKINDYKNVSMEQLSMGMSGDYLEAMEQGANIVRIGEGIFGKRNYNSQEENKNVGKSI